MSTTKKVLIGLGCVVVIVCIVVGSQMRSKYLQEKDLAERFGTRSLSSQEIDSLARKLTGGN